MLGKNCSLPHSDAWLRHAAEVSSSREAREVGDNFSIFSQAGSDRE